MTIQINPEAVMDGRVCIVTGANSGLGRATALALAKMGATVVLVCRNRNKGQVALSEIAKESGNQSIDLMIADLSSLQSVQKLAREFQDRYPKLHVLINNAGLVNLRRYITIDGYEKTFATNYLSPFLLTNLLLNELKSSAPSRIVTGSSGAHYGGHIDFGDLQNGKRYGGMRAYGQSKLALVLFTRELAKRLAGSGVTAYSLHPGVVATNIWSRPAGVAWFIMVIPKLFMASPGKGAETIVYLATAPGIENLSGEYFEKKKVKRSSEESYNDNVSEKLWDSSGELTKLFPAKVPDAP